MKKERGLFIVFEGLDRCGKSTQVKLLTEYFIKCNLDAQQIQFPNRTTIIGGMISSYLKGTDDLSDEVVHLLFAANRWEKNNELKAHLERGVHVVCDRYTYSGVAFSSAKGLPIAWCQSSDSRLIKPDVVIYLQAPLSELTGRGDYGMERYERVDFQSKVKEQFDKMIEVEQFSVIKADQDQSKVHDDIVQLVLSRLSDARGELQLLWTDDQR